MEMLLNSIVKAAGWSIIHSLWQGAVLYISLLLIIVLIPRTSAKAKHNLSFITLCGMAAWFIITFYNELSTRLLIIEKDSFISVYQGAAATIIDNSFIELSDTLLNRAERTIPLIVFIYSIGIFLQLIYLAFGYHRIRQIRNTGLSDLRPDLLEKFSPLIAGLEIKRKISFKLSSIISVPMVIGYFKPIVLLPLSILAQIDQQQLEAIVIHELSHIRRNDYLLNLFKIGIETILFFNPFVWLTGRLIDTERENACDDLVLKMTGSPLSYAQTLLELEKIKTDQQLFTLAATGKKHHLLNRIKRITTMKTTNSNLKQQLFGVFLIAATIVSISWIGIKKDNQTAATKPKIELDALKKSKANLMERAHNRQFNKPAFVLQTDTTKKKIKIIVTDEKGNVKEYNTIKELPADVRADFTQQSMFPGMPPLPPMPPVVDTSYLAAVTKMYNTPEWKKNIEEIQGLQKKMMDSPDWKKFNEDVANKFNGEEWAKSMNGLKEQFDRPEWKDRQKEFQKKFDSDEWKAKMQDFEKQFDSKAWQKASKNLEKMFESDEWKSKMKNFEKQFESDEWKAYFKSMKDMFPEAEKVKKAD